MLRHRGLNCWLISIWQQETTVTILTRRDTSHQLPTAMSHFTSVTTDVTDVSNHYRNMLKEANIKYKTKIEKEDDDEDN